MKRPTTVRDSGARDWKWAALRKWCELSTYRLSVVAVVYWVDSVEWTRWVCRVGSDQARSGLSLGSVWFNCSGMVQLWVRRVGQVGLGSGWLDPTWFDPQFKLWVKVNVGPKKIHNPLTLSPSPVQLGFEALLHAAEKMVVVFRWWRLGGWESSMA